MKNFTRPKDEIPYYYSSTVEDGKVVEHEGEEEHAVYMSELNEGSRRANLWHAWLEKNVANPHDSLGAVRDEVYAEYQHVLQVFMDGEIYGEN